MITQNGVFIGRLEATIGTAPTIKVYNASNSELTVGSAWVVPLIQSFSLQLKAVVEGEMTVDYTGDVAAVHWSGQYLEATMRIKPFGSSLANAILSAKGLDHGYTVETAGFVQIQLGPWTDALNVSSSGGLPHTARWIYFGKPIDLTGGQAAEQTITLRRFPKIAGGAAITS